MRTIGYLSFDASVKIHESGRYASTKANSKGGYGGITGYIRHIDRGTDRRNGCEVQHSNPDINADYTLENESYFKDENGIWQVTDQSKDMLGAVNRRMQYAREHGARIANKGKNDTVIARPIVVQLDKETIEEHKDWVWDAIEIIEEMFQEKNIVGFSIHKDETNVHIHIIFVPCHERKKDDGQIKCAISQTKFFRNPRELAGMHRKIRKELKAKGYEIEEENKPLDEQLAGYYDRNGEWHQQGLTPDQLKQLTNQELNLQMEEIEMRLKKEELDRLEQAMQKIQSQSKAKQEELDQDRAQLESQAKSQQEELDQERARLQSQLAELEKEKASVQAQMQDMAAEKLIVEQEKMEAKKLYEEANEAANGVLEKCRQLMNDKSELDPDFLKYLDKKSKRVGKNYRTFVAGLHREYLNDTTSDWNETNEWQDIRAERKRMGCVRPTSSGVSLDETIYSTPSV